IGNYFTFFGKYKLARRYVFSALSCLFSCFPVSCFNSLTYNFLNLSVYILLLFLFFPYIGSIFFLIFLYSIHEFFLLLLVFFKRFLLLFRLGKQLLLFFFLGIKLIYRLLKLCHFIPYFLALHFSETGILFHVL